MIPVPMKFDDGSEIKVSGPMRDAKRSKDELKADGWIMVEGSRPFWNKVILSEDNRFVQKRRIGNQIWVIDEIF